jgi:hypothetical protein
MKMSNSDLIALGALVVAFASLFVAWRASRKVEDNARENTNIQHAVIESELRQAVESAKSRVNEIGLLLMPLRSKKEVSSLSLEENLILEGYYKSFDAAVESMLNTYENACSNHLDGKIDKTRFKRNYHVEIRNLLEKEELKKYFDPTTTRYKPLLKVYKEWNDHENA